MTRREENNNIIDSMLEEVNRKPTGPYNEMMMLHLGAIATMLADISRSLAIIADAESEEK